MNYFIPLLTLLLFTGFRPPDKKTAKVGAPIKITWTDSIPGDFSFTKEWSYFDGVYLNAFGQLSCDGLCPPETDAMKDSLGRIYDDSLARFYSIIDTSHQMHTISCEAWCYEWDGSDYISGRKINKDSFFFRTAGGIATHCSLHLLIVKSKCIPAIYLNSIVPGGSGIYPCTGGYIHIDRRLWKKGIFKADFSFQFEHKENPAQPMFWKGRTYTRIENL